MLDSHVSRCAMEYVVYEKIAALANGIESAAKIKYNDEEHTRWEIEVKLYHLRFVVWRA